MLRRSGRGMNSSKVRIMFRFSYAALTAHHLLRYRPSEILDVCAIYISGLLRTLALNLTHCEEPRRGVALPV